MNDEIKQNTIPLKNYLMVILMFIAIILITIYIFKWYQIKQDEKKSQSYLIENNLVTNQTNSIEELDNVLADNSSRFILYITYTHSSRIYNLEKSYKNVFKEYNLNDMFYLFDITNIKKSDKNYMKSINKHLDIDVNKYPVIIYYEDGQINSYKSIKNKKDFENFIKKINIEKNSQ